MVVYTSPQAGPTKTAGAVGWAQEMKVAVGSIPDVSAAAGTAVVTTGGTVGDAYYMVKLPKGAVVTGGRFRGSRMASGTSFGSAGLQWTVGFTGAVKTFAGLSYGATSSSLLLGTISPNFAEVSGTIYDSGADAQLGGLLYTAGPILLTEDQYVQLKLAVVAVSFISAAHMSLEIDYYMTQHA